MFTKPGNDKIRNKLKAAGLRPTRQRLALGALLFCENRHVTAEKLHEEVAASGLTISLATVYNTLNQFTQAGLLRDVVVDAQRTYFDTNTLEHHHFFDEATGELMDIPPAGVGFEVLPQPPHDRHIRRVDVIVRLAAKDGTS